jgi:uncharacterized protein (UPF0335 family)
MATGMQKSAQESLQRIVQQIEKLDEERKALSADISDKFKESKGLGFDVKILRQILKLRKLSQSEREEADSILEIYAHALGMLPQQADIEDAPAREMEDA